MLHLSGVLGDWKMNKESWRFKVNTRAGGKLFTIKEGLKFDEMVEMVHEDFGINRLGNECCLKKKRLGNELELSYALPESMLRDMPKDTPMFL